MRGFQPAEARAKAKNYADGGVVHSIKGMLGLRPRTPDELRAADAKAQARNQEASASVAERAQSAPAPSPAPSGGTTTALSGYSGMTAVERREKAAGFANGGLVRGPGSGTSDDVPDEVPQGTYIMPADSTDAVGVETLESMGAPRGFKPGGEKSVPVNLSNGEFKMPPEQVHAVGVQALDQMKNATHKPVRGFAPQAQPEEPRQFFVDGGVVGNEVARVGNSYSGGNVSGGIAVNGHAPGGAVSSTSWTTPAPAPAPAPSPTIVATNTVAPAAPAASPAPAPAAPMGWAERNAQRSTEVTASSIMDSPERRAAQASLAPAPAPASAPVAAGAQPAPQNVGSLPQPRQPVVGFQPRRYANGGVVLDEGRQSFANGGEVKRLVAGFMPGTRAVFNESGKAIGDLASQGRYGAAAGETARAALAYGPAVVDDVVGGAWRAAAPAVADAGKQFLGVGGTSAPAPQEQVAAAPAAQPATAPQTAPVAAAQPDVASPPSAPAPAASAAPRNGGQISAQNMAAADAMAGRQSQAPVGFAPAGVAAPVLRNSTNDWAARKALENAATSASSITNNGGKFDRSGPGDSVAMAGYKAALATDQASQQAQAGLEQTAMRENGGLQREQVQQTGANERSARGFQVDSRRADIEGKRANSEIEARGFQTRALQQQEQLREVLTNPNSTPQQKAQAQGALQALSGKGDSWKAVALQGGTDAQGNKTESILGAVNERTGEMKRMDGQGGAAGQAAPQDASQRRVGTTYTLPNGKLGQWTEKGWLLVG